MMDVKDRLRAAFADRHILITGGASFIGSHLAELLVDAGAVVTVADDLSSGKLENLAATSDTNKIFKRRPARPSVR